MAGRMLPAPVCCREEDPKPEPAVESGGGCSGVDPKPEPAVTIWAGCISEEGVCCWEGAGRNDACCRGGKLVANACSPRLEELAGVGGTCWG